MEFEKPRPSITVRLLRDTLKGQGETDVSPEELREALVETSSGKKRSKGEDPLKTLGEAYVAFRTSTAITNVERIIAREIAVRELVNLVHDADVPERFEETLRTKLTDDLFPPKYKY